MPTLVPAVALMALVYAVIQWFKSVTNKDWPTALGQVIVWGVGIGAAFLAAHASILQSYVVAGHTVASLDGWSLVLFGTAIASAATGTNTLIKAIDVNQSAAPSGPLVPPKA